MLKSLGVVLTRAAAITPAFNGRAVGTLNAVRLLIAVVLICTGLFVTPKD